MFCTRCQREVKQVPKYFSEYHNRSEKLIFCSLFTSSIISYCSPPNGGDFIKACFDHCIQYNTSLSALLHLPRLMVFSPPCREEIIIVTQCSGTTKVGLYITNQSCCNFFSTGLFHCFPPLPSSKRRQWKRKQQMSGTRYINQKNNGKPRQENRKKKGGHIDSSYFLQEDKSYLYGLSI